MACSTVPVHTGFVRHAHAPVLECLFHTAGLAWPRCSLAQLVTAAIPPISEVLLEVPVSGYDIEFAIYDGHVERNQLEHTAAQQLVQLGLI
jgi:hypothetical protein